MVHLKARKKEQNRLGDDRLDKYFFVFYDPKQLELLNAALTVACTT